MQCTIEELKAIVDSLKTPTRRDHPETVKSCLEKVMQKGFAAMVDVGDVFYYSDERLEQIRNVVPAERWCEIFSIHVQDYFRRPQRRESEVWGSTGVSTEDLVHLLINIERVGYSINPFMLVTKLLPKLVESSYVTNSGLSILWYEKRRHKMDGLFFSVKYDERGQVRNIEKFKTATGYKVEVTWNEDAAPVQITIIAPKYRKARSKPAPKPTKCEECGYEWLRGDIESSAAHRREHAIRLKYLDPKPNRRINKEVQGQDGLFLVITNSKKWIHGEIYLRALAFKKELRYDFVQWDSSTGDPDSSVHGYLFISTDNVVVGACAFRLCEYEDEDMPIRRLDWIWVTPKYRRAGVLTRHWKTLRERYGDFRLASPVSEAMVAFLKKNGDQKLLADTNVFD